MPSGKYSALTGAISREQRLANIATNLANVNTIGYKKNNMTFEKLVEKLIFFALKRKNDSNKLIHTFESDILKGTTGVKTAKR